MAGTKRKPDEPTDDRVLPHSLDAERAVLGGVLLNNQAYFDAAWLPPEAFYRRASFEAVGQPYEEAGIAHITMRRSLQG